MINYVSFKLNFSITAFYALTKSQQYSSVFNINFVSFDISIFFYSRPLSHFFYCIRTNKKKSKRKKRNIFFCCFSFKLFIVVVVVVLFCCLTNHPPKSFLKSTERISLSLHCSFQCFFFLFTFRRPLLFPLFWMNTVRTMHRSHHLIQNTTKIKKMFFLTIFFKKDKL